MGEAIPQLNACVAYYGTAFSSISSSSSSSSSSSGSISSSTNSSGSSSSKGLDLAKQSMITPRMMLWAGNVARRGEMINGYWVLIEER